jgi:hypothetical protein
MLRGQLAIFLSCSEKFKAGLAWPIRDALTGHGLRAIIVSDEPLLPSPGPDAAEAKAEPYLDASSAFVALCTADYELSDGSRYPRANIIDEIQQASSRPYLRDRSQVLKSPGVLLPSDVIPTYDSLDVTRPAVAAQVVLKQLQQWGIGSASPAAAPDAAVAGDGTGGDADLAILFAGLRPGDRDEARRRVYRLLRDRAGERRRWIAAELHREITESGDQVRTLTAATLLEAASGVDVGLVPPAMIEALAAHHRYPARACAANVLRARSAVAPLDVPLEVLGRLAAPGREDWLVWAPALATVQELAGHRPDAVVILESLAASADLRDRHAAAVALLAVAGADPAAVPVGLARELAGDADPLVAAKALEVMAAVDPAGSA